MELTVNLPDPLAKEAEAEGLLGPQAIERLLREHGWPATLDNESLIRSAPQTMVEGVARLKALV